MSPFFPIDHFHSAPILHPRKKWVLSKRSSVGSTETGEAKMKIKSHMSWPEKVTRTGDRILPYFVIKKKALYIQPRGTLTYCWIGVHLPSSLLLPLSLPVVMIRKKSLMLEFRWPGFKFISTTYWLCDFWPINSLGMCNTKDDPVWDTPLGVDLYKKGHYENPRVITSLKLHQNMKYELIILLSF